MRRVLTDGFTFRHLHRALAASLLLLATAACSSAVLTDAATLSKKGQAAALAAQQSVVVSSNQFAAYQDSNIFIHGFTGVTAPPGSDEINDQKELTARAKLFASLADLYASFGDLASYGASAQIQTDLTNVFNNVDAYQKAVHRAEINPRAKSLIPPLAGAITGLIQTQMVLAANDQIRIQLVNAIDVMSDPLVRAQFVNTKQLIVTQLTGNAQLLLKRGLLSPKPYLDELGQPLGLMTADNASEILRKNPQLNAGLEAVVDSRRQAAVVAVAASYDDSVAALKALVPLHDRLKAGQPLDLTQIDAVVEQIRTIAAAAGPAPTTGAK